MGSSANMGPRGSTMKTWGGGESYLGRGGKPLCVSAQGWGGKGGEGLSDKLKGEYLRFGRVSGIKR